MKNNLFNFLWLSLAGVLGGYLHYLAFPPHQWLVFSFISLITAFLVFRSRSPWILKVWSFALMQFTFFFFYHQKSEWYLEIATRTEPLNYEFFKWAAIVQYSAGSILTFSIGLLLVAWKRIGHSKKLLPLIAAVTFGLQLFFSTSANENSYLIPFMASDLFKGTMLPLSLYLLAFYGLIFYCLENLLQKSIKTFIVCVLGLISFVSLNNVLCPPMNDIPENLVILSGESFNLDGRTKDDIEKHFEKFKTNITISNPIYIWPEAVVTYKKPNHSLQNIVDEVFQKNFPGKHFYGAYAVKENIPGESTNRYFSFDTKTGVKAHFNKAFPVPFQESSDYFWLIPQQRIGLSFNVKSSKEFGSFADHKNFAFYLCNEITELKHILSQYQSETELILVPSNTPAQNTQYYEDVLDFYSRVLSRIKRTPLIKVSSHGHIYVLNKDLVSSFKKPVYLTKPDK